jgi:hypothetical protein
MTSFAMLAFGRAKQRSMRSAMIVAGVFAASCAIGGMTAATHAARYQLEVVNTWSEATHPGAFPPGAHFSWFGGGTHDDGASFWEVGELASPGMVRMAETGDTSVLAAEVQAAIDAGHGGSVLEWMHWFCPADTKLPSCGELIVEFDVDDDASLVTLVSMLGPTPDWFVGTDGLPLKMNGVWREEVRVTLVPYDGGTRSANAWALFGPLTTPPDPITLITAESGQLVGPQPLGEMIFTLLPGPIDLDGNGTVGFADLMSLLAKWGPCPDGGTCCPGDIACDGGVGFDDVLALLTNWG